MSEVPYAVSSTILDCKQAANGYNKPSYPAGPSCNTKDFPSCDNRSYSAYATDSSYQGFYDNCFITTDSQQSCDLKYVNAAPKTVIDCWKNCCDSQMRDCNQNCHTSCVVSGGKGGGGNSNGNNSTPSNSPIPPTPTISNLNSRMK
jgi:hypothetical protein